MFAGVLAGRWPPVATLADHLLGREHALPLRPATDRAVWGPGGAVDRCTLETTGAVAAGERGTPWPGATARAYARYHTDGDRTEYEAAVSGRQQRLSRAAVMAVHTLEPTWVHEVADGVVVLCEQSSWCWPAHDDTFTRHGSVLPTVTDPYLDLGAGEVAGQLAWIDHLLGTVLDRHVPGLRARMRHEVRTRVLEPFLRRRDWHWLGLDGLRSWRRTAVLDRRHDTVTITDEWHHTGTPAQPSVLHHVLAGDVTRTPAGVLVRSLGGHLVHLGVPDGVPVDLTPRELTDPVLRDVWGERITRLDLTVTAPAGTLTIRITEASDD